MVELVSVGGSLVLPSPGAGVGVHVEMDAAARSLLGVREQFPALLAASGVVLIGSYHVLIRNTSVGRALGFASKRQGAPQINIKPPASAKLSA